VPSTVASRNVSGRTPNAASSRLVAANGITGDSRNSAITHTVRRKPRPSSARCTATARGESASARTARAPTHRCHTANANVAASSTTSHATIEPSTPPNR
jgi:predicted alpha/beta-fold hydrolase